MKKRNTRVSVVQPFDWLYCLMSLAIPPFSPMRKLGRQRVFVPPSNLIQPSYLFLYTMGSCVGGVVFAHVVFNYIRVGFKYGLPWFFESDGG